LNTPRHGPAYRRILGIAAVFLLLGWGLVVLVGRWRSREKEPPPDPIATAMAVAAGTPTPAPTPAPTGPARRATAQATTRGPVARATTVAEWRRQLASIPGIEVRDMGGTPRVVFAAPVFSALTTIDHDQKQRLLSVLTAIRARCDGCMVAVVGHTDNDPVRPGGAFASNEVLGKLRADAVVAFLTDQGGVPASHLHALSKGDQEPPFPNNSADNKRKNRTVTLEIIPPSGLR